MNENLTIRASIFNAMRDAGWLRLPSFNLSTMRLGDFKTKKVTPSRTRGSNTENTFRVELQGTEGRVTIPGSMLLNARVLAAAPDAALGTEASLANSEGVFSYAELEESLSGSAFLHERLDPEDPIFPQELRIVGAVVSMATTGAINHPAVALRNYRGYQAARSYHVDEAANEFMTRADLESYLGDVSVHRIEKLPSDVKELTFNPGFDVENSKNWFFNLLVTDVKYAE